MRPVIWPSMIEKERERERAKERADMEVSLPKTEYMLVRKDGCAGEVTEHKYDDMELKHECK